MLLKAKHHCKYHVKDTSCKRSLGGCKPDMTFWPKGETLINWNKAFLGDIKTLQEEGQFTETNKGKALTWAHCLLIYVANASTASVGHVLLDRHIMFFWICREPHGQVTYSWTAVVQLYKTKEAKGQGQKLSEIWEAASGFNWLKSLLAMDPRGKKDSS